MTLNFESTAARLGQQTNLARFTRQYAINEFLEIYLYDYKESEHLYFTYCTLIPSAKMETYLDDVTASMPHGAGSPGVTYYYENNQPRAEYSRFNNNEGLEPLVLQRHFNDLKEAYLEVAEEFRLYHNLFHDQSTNTYQKLDAVGNEETVLFVTSTSVKVRVLELRQFLAAKDMHLSLEFDWRENSPASFEELQLAPTLPEHRRRELIHYSHEYQNLFPLSGSRLLGKVMVPPLPKEKAGIWGFGESQPKKHVEYIIAATADGDQILCSSKPEDCAVHPLRPQYLTPVDFKKTVLDKYYANPSKYDVEDGYLRCGTLWGLMIDNHHTDKVTVWLGDLGRDLPEGEQNHWKAHNIQPTGEPSDTFIRSQLMAEFSESTRPEHCFPIAYRELRTTSLRRLGWSLYADLPVEDMHHLQNLRVPASNEQKEFDELVMSLTKLLVDYMQDSKLKTLTNPNNNEELKPGSINLLERVLQDHHIVGYEEHISFLRGLYSLRSKGSAHRKGSDYQKLIAAHKTASGDLKAIFEELLIQSNRAMIFFKNQISENDLANGFTAKETNNEESEKAAP